MSEKKTHAPDLKKHLSALYPDATVSVTADTCVLAIDQAAMKKPFTSLLNTLRDDPHCAFEQLIDITAIDRLHYGLSEWKDSDQLIDEGFLRAVETSSLTAPSDKNTPRFVLVLHLLSLKHNHRLRLKLSLKGDCPTAESATETWPAADWYEREVYDLFGVTFNNHPDLRRILTDYGFVGHPFRKDFPVHGRVDLSYDEKAKRCVYKPVDIEPHQNVAKVIRHDNRYTTTEKTDG
jgi:NADH-quinone oxidoreductase subunit C